MKHTNQTAFDAVWQRLVVNADLGPCRRENKCLYRDPETNNKCAVGALLTDGELEIFGTMDADVDYLVKKGSPSIQEVDIELLMEFQRIHDSDYLMAKTRLLKLASDFGLNV